jgi:hypothetical protein
MNNKHAIRPVRFRRKGRFVGFGASRYGESALGIEVIIIAQKSKYASKERK